jgi:hypothetical protein
MNAEAGRAPIVLGVTYIGAFIGQLDASIVQLALPTLKQAFGVPVNEVRWIAIAYLLAFASCLPGVAPAGSLVTGLSVFALFGVGLGLFVGPKQHCHDRRGGKQPGHAGGLCSDRRRCVDGAAPTGVLRQPQLKGQSGRNCRHDSRRTVSRPTTSAS